MDYGDYQRFMVKSFSFLSSPEIAEIYREMYHLSSGQITYKTLHYICGAKGLFIPLILAKRLDLAVTKTHNSDMLSLDIQNSITKMGVYLEDIGIE
jgi:hypothetical protein